jgi:hypothetical protein
MTDDLTVFFALLGSTHIKALRKMLVKSTPDSRLGSMVKKRYILTSAIKSKTIPKILSFIRINLYHDALK